MKRCGAGNVCWIEFGQHVAPCHTVSDIAILLPPELLKAVERHTFPDEARRATTSARNPRQTAIAPPQRLGSDDITPATDHCSNRHRIDEPHGAEQPSYYWTWRLLSAGFRLAECCEIRRMSAEQVINDAADALEHHLALDLSWVFTAEELAALENDLDETDRQTTVPSPRSALAAARRRLLLKCQQRESGENSPP